MTLTKIILARHATPDWNRTDLSYHLPPGPPLVPHGEEEARRLGKFLQETGVARIYTSPLERCRKTAQIAAETAGVPLEIVFSLTEWQPGESYEAIVKRLWPTFEAAQRACATQGPAALITHGGPVAAMLEKLGMDAATLLKNRIYDHMNPLPPAGAWQVSRSAAGEGWELELVFTP